MQTTSFAFLTISFCVYIFCTFTTVYGRCSGRWAIHACYGGNGKRSSPPEHNSQSDLNDKQFILRQLLLSDKFPSLEKNRLPDRSATSDRSDLSDGSSISDTLRQLSYGHSSSSLSSDSDFANEPRMADLDALYPELYPDRDREIDNVKTLLGELLLRRRFGDSGGEEYVYKR